MVDYEREEIKMELEGELKAMRAKEGDEELNK